MQNGTVSAGPPFPFALKRTLACQHIETSNLMAKDDFKNLGFKDETDSKKPEREKGVKGELQW